MSGPTYRVRVQKDELVFSAGHFITYNGGLCEPVHGHNYRVGVEVGGGLGGDSYVFDFIALRDLTREVTLALDHKMLLPTESRLITLEDDGPNWLVRYRDRRWSFPRDECALLPVENTTAERLADHVGDRLRALLGARKIALPATMAVEVEENFGQSAVSEWRGPHDRGE